MQRIHRAGRNPFTVMAIILLFIVIVFLISLNTGFIKIPTVDLLKTLVGAGTEQNRLIVLDFRLPRMVIALLIGSALAISGSILQGVSQNGLADPGVLGINAGSGLAVVLFIYLFQGPATAIFGVFYPFIMPVAALVGGMSAAFLIYILAWNKGITSVRLLLVGIGVNAAFGAALMIIQLRMNPNDFMQALVWLSGSIGGTSWPFVWAILPWTILLIPYAIYKARFLNALHLGDEIAIGLGTNVERERRILLLVSVALAGSAVAVGGGIAFLGLVAPHLAKGLVGPKYQMLLPTAALIGALLLLVADAIGRTALAPSEIPVGLVVSTLSAPYFIYLLMKT
ncbi:iron ABC transporter permease [Ammoniphilus oxalaticus]|uniref:Iron ABC transporter permease n=1 Tax=Ammoniphilus oxalaticus TaxID=66863 RepID=A0A419SKS1_9BACL|nr:iron ABC transporter permease [Ammoniphilus oxalaticus]RKD24526.1 iron ABC transporter permease [Ammoniphilus oxalaticus]